VDGCLRVPEQPLRRLEATARQIALEGKAGDPLRDPGQVRPAHPRPLDDHREGDFPMGVSLDELQDKSDNFDMLDRNLRFRRYPPSAAMALATFDTVRTSVAGPAAAVVA
jgi:hypothetical protein